MKVMSVSVLPLLSLTTPYEKVSQVSDTGRLWITSGAIQGNVPTKDMCVVWVKNLDAPKSQICRDASRIETQFAAKTKHLFWWFLWSMFLLYVYNISYALINRQIFFSTEKERWQHLMTLVLVNGTNVGFYCTVITLFRSMQCHRKMLFGPNMLSLIHW